MEGRSSRRYCTNACQMAAVQQRLITEWSTSGVAFVDSGKKHYIRTYLLEDQDELCAICRAGAVWNGAPLTFVLDHIDGDSGNNRRENLRLVCPNCDSQLPTFKSRNKGRGRSWRRQRYADGKSY
jgi:HNH endonuclease